MNTNPITIDDFVCTTEELIEDKPGGKRGGPNNCPLWDMSQYSQGMISKDDTYPTIAMALRNVCNVLNFDYSRKDWHFGKGDRLFHAEFYVDEDNRQIDEEEYIMWKRGEKRIWVCKVSVSMMVTETRKMNHTEIAKLGF
jgi:hypothetical protein